MRVRVQRSGGFANIGANAEVDTSTLSKEKAEEVQRLVAALPPQPPAPMRARQAADVYQYDITVDGKNYRADDPSLPDEWRALVDYMLKT
jgi:hypothetical protein